MFFPIYLFVHVFYNNWFIIWLLRRIVSWLLPFNEKKDVWIGKLQVERLAFCPTTLLGRAYPSCFTGWHWGDCSHPRNWASPYPSWIGWFHSYWDWGAPTSQSACMGMFLSVHIFYSFKFFSFMCKLFPCQDITISYIYIYIYWLLFLFCWFYQTHITPGGFRLWKNAFFDWLIYFLIALVHNHFHVEVNSLVIGL